MGDKVKDIRGVSPTTRFTCSKRAMPMCDADGTMSYAECTTIAFNISHACDDIATTPAARTNARAAAAPPPDPVVTVEEFRKLPVKGATVSVQPGPDTLKNYHTNVYATTGEQTLDTTLLGRPVTVRATPVSYVYDYGDGTVRETTDPGHALPAGSWDVPTSTSHQYKRPGRASIVVTTVYSGQYKVGNGAWKPVDGTIGIPSAPQPVTIWRTKTGWVSERCGNGAGAWGC